MSAPMRRRTSINPIRVGLSRVRSAVTSLPGDDCRGAQEKRGRRGVAGHIETQRQGQVRSLHRQTVFFGPQAAAHQGYQAFGVVAARSRFNNRGRAFGLETGQQDRGS